MAQQHANWIAQARAHWKEHRPKMYARMLEQGRLELELTEAASATADAMQSLINQGLTWDEAWEQTRERFLFLPAEASDEPLPPKSAGFKAHRDLTRGLGSLTMPGEKPPPE